MPKLSASEKAEIDRKADELYDKLNPRPHDVINVSKDECIRRVMREVKETTK